MTNRAGTTLINSPVGKIILAAREGVLTHLLFNNHQNRQAQLGDDSQASKRILAKAEEQLEEYFAGRRREFDLPLSPQGTEFQLSVWNGLLEIPFGETISYGELGRRVGRAKAVRAVGAANGANPISIIVPCHRVIGQDRRLTGYGGGLPAKMKLLQLEGAKLKGDRLV